jgi:hypothetical protein
LFAIDRSEVHDAGGELGTHASDGRRLVQAHLADGGVAGRTRWSNGDYRHRDLRIDHLEGRWLKAHPGGTGMIGDDNDLFFRGLARLQ